MNANAGINFDDGSKATRTATLIISINFQPLRGAADTLSEIATLTAVSDGPSVWMSGASKLGRAAMDPALNAIVGPWAQLGIVGSIRACRRAGDLPPMATHQGCRLGAPRRRESLRRKVRRPPHQEERFRQCAGQRHRANRRQDQAMKPEPRIEPPKALEAAARLAEQRKHRAIDKLTEKLNQPRDRLRPTMVDKSAHSRAGFTPPDAPEALREKGRP